MSKRLAITRAQARAIADVATERGCIVEVEQPDGLIYRIIPEALAREQARRTVAVDADQEIDL